MLPENVNTPRGQYLQAILSKVSQQEFSGWPMLKKDDYVAIGGLVVLFSYVDYNLRRLVEGYDDAELLQPPWKGKSKALRTADVAKAVQSMIPWPEINLNALKRIEELRGLRNLVAHFAIRRFPGEDAFVFIAKSARNHKKHFGGEPAPAASVTAVMDGPVLPGIIPELEGLQNWLAKATAEVEKQFEPLIPIQPKADK
jgi:hypothetical protein